MRGLDDIPLVYPSVSEANILKNQSLTSLQALYFIRSIASYPLIFDATRDVKNSVSYSGCTAHNKADPWPTLHCTCHGFVGFLVHPQYLAFLSPLKNSAPIEIGDS